MLLCVCITFLLHIKWMVWVHQLSPRPSQVTHVFLQRIEEMEREAMDRDQQLKQLAGQVRPLNRIGVCVGGEGRGMDQQLKQLAWQVRA